MHFKFKKKTTLKCVLYSNKQTCFLKTDKTKTKTHIYFRRGGHPRASDAPPPTNTDPAVRPSGGSCRVSAAGDDLAADRALVCKYSSFLSF